MTKKTLLGAALLAGGFAIAAATGPAGAQAIYSSDKDFVAKASGGNTFEIESSQLALKVSHSDKIRAFASMMIADHTKAERSLRKAVTLHGAMMGPRAPQMSVMDNLKALSRQDGDGDFNAAYIDAQAKAHSDTAGLLSEYKAEGKDEALLRWTDETLPVVKQHQAEVDKLQRP